MATQLTPVHRRPAGNALNKPVFRLFSRLPKEYLERIDPETAIPTDGHACLLAQAVDHGRHIGSGGAFVRYFAIDGYIHPEDARYLTGDADVIYGEASALIHWFDNINLPRNWKDLVRQARDARLMEIAQEEAAHAG